MMAKTCEDADTALQPVAEPMAFDQPSYKSRGVVLRLTDVAETSLEESSSSESTCVPSEGAAPVSLAHKEDGPAPETQEDTRASSRSPRRRSVTFGMSVDVAEVVTLGVAEDSDGDCTSPLSKSAKRRLRRRRQREAIKAVSDGPAGSSSTTGRVWSASRRATVTELGLTVGSSGKAGSAEFRWPSTPLGSDSSSVPCSPSCARVGSNGIVSTSPCHSSATLNSTASDASTRTPSCASTPAGNQSFAPFLGHATVLDVCPLSPAAAQFPHPHASIPFAPVANVRAAAASGVHTAVASLAPASMHTCIATMPGRQIGDAAPRPSNLGEPAAASQGSLCATHVDSQSVQSRSALHTCLPNVFTVQPATWDFEGRNPARTANPASVDEEVIAGAAVHPEPDTFKILFGAIGPPPSMELVARLQASVPEQYDD